ncbi:MAG: alkyl hydroperoxide reductase [Actinomycetia bacterium]|nr:alkyl hydroperoxide reductase [Actinomycetes bacterium]
MPTRVRVRAPELRGSGGWLNTGGRELSLAGLRGRIVLLDFWTFCCVNCLHVLDELRPLERKYGDQLVVIGVHSPKFEHEREHAAVVAAVERYGVEHPVLDDPELVTWGQYAAKAWPTIAVVDPEGYLVASMAGEGHAAGLDQLVGSLIEEHRAKGTLASGGEGPYVPPPPAGTLLRFPGKIAVLPNGNLLVSDSANHSLAELAPDGETLVRRIGEGTRGTSDGGPAQARFSEPQGIAVLPAEIRSAVGYDVVVADTVNHLLRGVRLGDGTVTTVAGSGRQWRADVSSADPLAHDLSSPWDLAWYGGALIVAMAGIHQLWRFDPVSGELGPWAGTTVESLKDGPLAEVWMAQPSGLDADGDRLWIADSETSALRYVEGGEMHTAVGQGLFDFGHVDGPADQALFQHPLGVCVLPDGSVAVCDTYNNAIRRYDPVSGLVSTLADGVAEPSGAVVLDGQLVVVESAAHRVSRPVAPGTMRQVAGTRHRTARPRTLVAPGKLELRIVFEPGPGQKLDDRYGPPARLTVTADPPELLADGSGAGTELTRILEIGTATEGVLQVVAQAASCDDEGENQACHLIRQDWGVPIRVDPSGQTRLGLVLRGMDE